MSLPSESVFKCAGHSSSECDRLIVDYGNEGHLYLSTIEHGEGRADVILSKDQVQSLRDQLTAWLGDGEDFGLPLFAKMVMKKLRRFNECATDFEAGGVDLSREWLDVLTHLGLLDRIQRSPAMWQISADGEEALEAKP